MTTKKTKPALDWAARHGTALGTVNAAGSALSVAMVGNLAGIDPLWPALATGAGTVGTLAAGTARGLTRPSLAYRAACWLLAGGWTTWAIAHDPWSLDAIGALAAGAVGMGVLAPGFAKYERHQREERRRALLATQRTRLAEEWEDRLARVCHVKGAQVVGVQHWAEGTGYTLDVELPTGGVTWKQVATHEDGLASDARLPEGCGVEVTPGAHRGTCLIRVATENALAGERPFPEDYSHATINNPFPIGVYRDGSPTLAELRWICGLLVGQTGSGKTNTLQVINAQLVRCVDTLVWHIDLAGGGIALPWLLPWVEGRAERPAIDWVAATPDEADLMTTMALQIINIRKAAYKQRMREANDDKIPVGPDLPEIIVVADEFAELPAKVKANLESISNTGRAAGVRTLCCALRGTGDYVPAAIKKHAALRIGMRVQDQDELAYLFSWGNKLPDPQDAPYEGCGFIVLGQQPARPFKAYRLRPSQIEDIAYVVADRRPALDQVSANVPSGKAYATRWERVLPLLFDTAPATIAAPAAGQGAGELPNLAGAAGDALRRVDEARRRLRRTVAEAEGRDPDLDEQFRALVQGLDDIDWTDPTAWPVPILDRADNAPGEAAGTGRPVPELLLRVLRVMDEAGVDRMHTARLADALDTDAETLGALLPKAGVRTLPNPFWADGVKARGYARADIEQAIQRIRTGEITPPDEVYRWPEQ